ncbi:MAG: S-adenosyl-l-methionine hydroxide adenosyltransferase family protein, partial [Nitrospinales bacterium]
VDPGVGSARRPIAVQTADYTFVAPDNGILSFVFHDESCRVYELTKPKYFLAPVSATFHGRDIFAPAAAWIAKGTRLSAMGKKIDDPAVLELPEPTLQGGVLKGKIIYIDRFGNLTTNISAEVLWRSFPRAKAFRVKVGSGQIAGLSDCYSQCQKGEMGCILNSWDRLEIFRREGSAARRLKTRIGAAVAVTVNRLRK